MPLDKVKTPTKIKRVAAASHYRALHHPPVNVLSDRHNYELIYAIYKMFENGHTFPDIQDALKEVHPKTILLGRAFYMAANPIHYRERRQQFLRVLCDENVDETYLTDGAREVFGYATHIRLQGMRGIKDSLVWARANGRFNVIITKDKAVVSDRQGMGEIDLTRCALLRWKHILLTNGGVVNDAIRGLPVLIHVMDASLKGNEVKKLLRKHREEIFEIYEERVSPIIELHHHKVCPGIHFRAIIETPDVNVEFETREDSLNAQWLKKIFAHAQQNRRDITENDLERIKLTVQRALEHFSASQDRVDELTIPIKERAKIRRLQSGNPRAKRAIIS